MNQAIRNLENLLMNVLNSSDLPAEVKRVILGKLEAQMTNLSNQEILRVAEEAEKKEDAESV